MKSIPEVIHGDLDSLLPKAEEYYRSSGSQIIQDTDQMSTDFMKCLKLISARASDMSKGPSRKLDVVALGSLGGRVDQGLSQLHHLYMASEDTSLGIGRIIFFTPESIIFLLQRGHSGIYTPLYKGSITENVGIIPIGRPAVISTRGLEWDVHEWKTEFGGRISTILLGEDDQAALEYVKATRERLVQQFRVAFSYMVELEKKGYGESSYFVAGQLREEMDDSGSDDCSSMGSLRYGSTESNTGEEESDDDEEED
ncbi:hypothetical protein GP486_006103 [Trichoglossum hirsutum]|uniref:Thiamine diphosphokinase n=1 Tax=Trichoglossum hirsutum TaxID=265104 RepID=A0A9P8L7Z9_9PEZI|nr:hypothetical protein GP486_006103 [Trichoglossum hirsutum]